MISSSRRFARQTGEQGEARFPAISASAGRSRSGTWRSPRVTPMPRRRITMLPEPRRLSRRGAGHCGHAIRRAAGRSRKRPWTIAAAPFFRGRRSMPVGVQSARRRAYRIGRWSEADGRVLPQDRPQRKSGGVWLDARRPSTTARLISATDDLNAIAKYLKSLPATTAQAAPVYDEAMSKARSERQPTAAGGGNALPRLLRLLSWRRRQGPSPLYSAARRQRGLVDGDPQSLINLTMERGQPSW